MKKKKTLISKVTLRSKPPGPQDHRALVPIATQLQNKANISRRLAAGVTAHAANGL